MAAKFDLEQLLVNIDAILKAGLNAKLAEITAEKGDAIALGTVQTEAFYLNSLAGSTINYDPFVLTMVTDLLVSDAGPEPIEEPVIHVAICFVDSGNDPDVGRKFLRYQRALKEVLAAEFGKNRNRSKFKIQGLNPVNLRLANSSREHKAVGVEITTYLG